MNKGHKPVGRSAWNVPSRTFSKRFKPACQTIGQTGPTTEFEATQALIEGGGCRGSEREDLTPKLYTNAHPLTMIDFLQKIGMQPRPIARSSCAIERSLVLDDILSERLDRAVIKLTSSLQSGQDKSRGSKAFEPFLTLAKPASNS